VSGFEGLKTIAERQGGGIEALLAEHSELKLHQ